MRFSSFRPGVLGTLLLLGLAGCQTGPTLSQRLHAFIGQTETAIVQGLGIPQRSITTGGIKYLAYDWQSTQIIPGSAAGWGGWGGGPWGPWGGGWGGGFYAPPTVVTTGCEATFQMGPGDTGADVAVAVILRGNACE